MTYLEIDNPPPVRRARCHHCNDATASSVYDYVRGKYITDHCQYC